ncbi:hypothetical protein [Streptomyces sp. NPDC093261]|uniref:hypothetical protein n=1 Tax=Streptomyces sp. NPDC093261 TaxID=3366037 RepID=UPI0038017B59
MNKLVRRVSIVAASAAFVGGVLFAAGGPAAAAAPQAAGHIPARVAVVQDGHTDAAEHVTVTVNGRVDPWIADQLDMYDHSVARGMTTYDTWIMDQLAQFTAPATGHASVR